MQEMLLKFHLPLIKCLLDVIASLLTHFISKVQMAYVGDKQNMFLFIQFNVPFKIIPLIETSQSIGGANQEYPGKTT